MKGVILAAGDGGRLHPYTQDTPKVLLRVGGQRLIGYALDALGAAGISEIAVVVGHQSEKIQAALEDNYPLVTFVYNENHVGENALSVHAARQFVGCEPFVLSMGDHVTGTDIVQRLLADEREDCVLCVDSDARHSSQINDGTRVDVDSCGYIRAMIGKDLEVWNAIDTGVFMMTEEVFPVIEHLTGEKGIHVGITDMINYMGEINRPFAACDVRGTFWADIDTPEDYASVDSLLKAIHGHRV